MYLGIHMYQKLMNEETEFTRKQGGEDGRVMREEREGEMISL